MLEMNANKNVLLFQVLSLSDPCVTTGFNHKFTLALFQNQGRNGKFLYSCFKCSKKIAKQNK